MARRGRSLAATWRIVGWTVVLGALALAAAIAPPTVFLRKLVGFAVMPATLAWLTLIALLIRSWSEPRWRWAHVTVLAAYTLAGSPWSAYLLLTGLEGPFLEMRPLDEPTRYDAIAVMGGGSAETPSKTPQLSLSGDRIRLGAALFAQNSTSILVTSGSTVDGKRDVSAETEALWVEMGVPSAAIIRVPRPQNSAQEIAALAALATERGWKRVGLVTSARHLPRALALCERRELEVVPLPADFRAEAPGPGILGVVPSGDAFGAVSDAAWEYVGLAAVHLIGG